MKPLSRTNWLPIGDETIAPEASGLRGSVVSYELPAEITRRRDRGLLAASLGLAAVVIGALVANYLAGPDGWGDRGVWLACFLAIFSLLVALVSRRRGFSPQGRLNLATFHLIASSLCINGLENIVAWPTEGFTRGISWVALWILVGPVMLPTRPLRAVLVGLACATMVPIGAAIAIAMGNPVPSLLTAATYMLPNYVAVVLATIASGVIYKLGTDVSRARQLGNYELIELLGSGGMGEVWRAQHRLLSRQAAVKLVRSVQGQADDGGLRTRRFEREASATAMLRSPHTVQLYDFGVAPDGTLYYVMELLEGVDLESMVRIFGRLPVERAVFILRQICRSLAEAHEVGLVHRDIKPGNVCLCRLGTDFDFVKVLDFGLARTANRGDANWQNLTTEGWIGGTPAYMAPEVLMQGGAVDRRVDIYAFGCLAYWLLAGEMVFDAESPSDLVRQHLSSPPRPLAQRGVTGVPVALEAVIMQCLAKSPADRPADMQSISERLKGLDDGWSADRARDWWEQNAAAIVKVKAESNDTKPATPQPRRPLAVAAPRTAHGG